MPECRLPLCVAHDDSSKNWARSSRKASLASSATVHCNSSPGLAAVRLGRFVRPADGLEADAPDPFTAEEVARLLETTEQEVPEWHAFVLTLARTGLRIGEGLALQRDDVDLRRRTLWVRRTWTRGRLGTMKGSRSRAVDLTPKLVDVLADRISLQDTEAAVAGQPASPWLFPGPTGDPWDDRWVRWHVWQPLLRRAGLRYRGPHQLRHTYATLLIAAGAHPKYIQAQLGHASIQITMDVYGHLFPGPLPGWWTRWTTRPAATQAQPPRRQ